MRIKIGLQRKFANVLTNMLPYLKILYTLQISICNFNLLVEKYWPYEFHTFAEGY